MLCTSEAALSAGATRIELLQRAGSETLSTIDPAEVLACVRRSGAVLLRGFSTSLSAFCQFTERFDTHFIRYPCVNRVVLSDDGTLQLVSPDERAIPLHAELCYLPGGPDICWFHCGRADGQGGETLLADGVAIARALTEDDAQLPLDRPIRYRLELPAEVYPLLFGTTTLRESVAHIRARGWSHAFSSTDDQLAIDWQTSLFMKVPGSGAPAFVNQLLYWGVDSQRITWADGSSVARSVFEAAERASERCTLALAWQPGDVLLFDNRRFLHGRRRITDPERRIYTRFGIGLGLRSMT